MKKFTCFCLPLFENIKIEILRAERWVKKFNSLEPKRSCYGGAKGNIFRYSQKVIYGHQGIINREITEKQPIFDWWLCGRK